MKKVFLSSVIFVLLSQTGIAQQIINYRLHVIARDGKVVNKMYRNTEELHRDPAIKELHIGYLENEQFVFTPLESKHKAFFVETIGENAEDRHFQFEAWDTEAARQINIATTPPPAPAVQSGQEFVAVGVNGSNLEKRLLQELIKDGIIKDAGKLSITFTRKIFIVNSVKQSPQILAKYLALAESVKGEQLSENFRMEYVIN